MKRIFLFLLTNIAVLVVLSISIAIIEKVFGIDLSQLDQTGGLNMQGLLIFAAILGFGGSLISLAMSKWMAKRATGAVVIESPRNSAEQWLVETVRRQAKQVGIGMPEVAIYEAPDINAFATGMRREQRARGREHRAAGGHGSRRGRGGAGPRGHARRQRRHDYPSPSSRGS